MKVNYYDDVMKFMGIMNFFTNTFEGEMHMNEKKPTETYQKPVAEIVEFELKDHIASSADNGSDTICSESIFD